MVNPHSEKKYKTKTKINKKKIIYNKTYKN